MDDLDVIEFDKDAGEVAPGPNAPLLDLYLGVETKDSPNWPIYYLALSVGGSATLAGLVLALFAALSGAQLGY